VDRTAAPGETCDPEERGAAFDHRGRSAKTIMKSIYFVAIVFSLELNPTALRARPVATLETAEGVRSAEIIVVIRPKSSRVTSDKPDDGSFGTRPLNEYEALETECEVIAILKGSIDAPSVKLVHFAYKQLKPEFNGGLFMCFLSATNRLLTFPESNSWIPDTSKRIPYADSQSEYLAFLRRLPDGRFAPVAPQYDAAGSFRLLSLPFGAQRYYVPDAFRHKQEPK
jgi:hypothetical protein